MPCDSQIRSTMSLASPIAVFIKGYIKNPVQIVLYSPMRLSGRIDKPM